MSQENVEVVKRLNAAFNAGAVEEAVALFAADAEVIDLLNAPDVPQTVRGRPAIRELLSAWINAFDEFSGHVDEYIDIGDVVICMTRYQGRGKASGLTVDFQGADVHELRDEHVVRSTLGYPTKATALAVLGLSG